MAEEEQRARRPLPPPPLARRCLLRSAGALLVAWLAAAAGSCLLLITIIACSFFLLLQRLNTAFLNSCGCRLPWCVRTTVAAGYSTSRKQEYILYSYLFLLFKYLKYILLM